MRLLLPVGLWLGLGVLWFISVYSNAPMMVRIVSAMAMVGAAFATGRVLAR